MPAGALITPPTAARSPRTRAWARFGKQFDPPLNLKDRQALGLWIEGDGPGELIAVRLESPQHLAFGAVADRYVTVDFTGAALVHPGRDRVHPLERLRLERRQVALQRLSRDHRFRRRRVRGNLVPEPSAG